MELAKTHKAVVRPLHVLVPLIREDLKHGQEAAEEAGLPYYQSVGEKLIEARGQLHGQFQAWVKRNFRVSITQAALYMKLARATTDGETYAQGNAEPVKSLHEFRRSQGQKQTVYPQPWHHPIKEAIGRVDISALKQAALEQQKERALQRKLALSLVDIGYKALATKLHPDKGGSAEAMARLNKVRKLLQEAVTL